jgi:P4 family phage/plasmid primase-like protien
MSSLTIAEMQEIIEKETVKVQKTEMLMKAVESEKLNDYNDLFKGHQGHSKIIAYLLDDTVKMISDKIGYYFNPITMLWDEKDIGFFNVVTSERLSELIITHLSDNEHKEDYEKLSKILTKVLSVDHCEKVFKMAKYHLMDNKFQAKLNASTHELPIKDDKNNRSIIDLKTSKVRIRNRSDFFTYECDVEFLKDSNLENAKRFFNDIMCNDQEVIDYLQMLLGYCMTGEIDLRSIFIFWGIGSNGKSVLCDLMKRILNDGCQSVDKKVFIKTENNSSHTAHLIPLVNCRLALYSESEKKDKLNESLLKALTGDDPISARALYGKQFTFKPTSKYIMLTNHKPEIDTQDQAGVDRFKLVPFEARFVDEPKNNEIKRNLKFIEDLRTKYLSEVFTWLCFGAYRYYQTKKIIPPKKCQDATNDYIKELDSVQHFIDEQIKQTLGCRIRRSDVYESYSVYCDQEGHTAYKKPEFFKIFKNKGYVESKVNGDLYFKDISYNLGENEQELI